MSELDALKQHRLILLIAKCCSQYSHNVVVDSIGQCWEDHSLETSLNCLVSTPLAQAKEKPLRRIHPISCPTLRSRHATNYLMGQYILGYRSPTAVP